MLYTPYINVNHLGPLSCTSTSQLVEQYKKLKLKRTQADNEKTPEHLEK